MNNNEEQTSGDQNQGHSEEPPRQPDDTDDNIQASPLSKPPEVFFRCTLPDVKRRLNKGPDSGEGGKS